MSQRTDSQRNNPLSTAEARDLIENIYKHADQYWLNITDNDIVIAYDIANDKFYKATHENVWNATDPIQYLIDDLTSTDGTSSALSANQGRVLKELLDNLNEDLDAFKEDTAIKFDIVNTELVRLDTFIKDVDNDLNTKITNLRFDMNTADEALQDSINTLSNNLNERIDDVITKHDEDVVAIKAITDNLNDTKLNNTPTDVDRVKYFDELPVEGSTRYINSGGVESAIKTAVTAMYIAKGNATVVDGIVKKGDVDATHIVGYTYNLIDIEPDTQVDVFINGIDASGGVMKCSLWDDLCWTDDGWNLMSKHINLDDYAMKDWTDTRIPSLPLSFDSGDKTIVDAINTIETNLINSGTTSNTYTDNKIAELKKHIEDNFHQYYTTDLPAGTVTVSDDILNGIVKRGTHVFNSDGQAIGIVVIDNVVGTNLFGIMSQDDVTYVLNNSNTHRDTETNSIRNSRRKVVTNHYGGTIVANTIIAHAGDTSVDVIPHLNMSRGIHVINDILGGDGNKFIYGYLSIIKTNNNSQWCMEMSMNGNGVIKDALDGTSDVIRQENVASYHSNRISLSQAAYHMNMNRHPTVTVSEMNYDDGNLEVGNMLTPQGVNVYTYKGMGNIRIESILSNTTLTAPIGNIKTIKSDNITNTAKITTDTLEAKTIKSTTTTASSNFFKQ